MAEKRKPVLIHSWSTSSMIEKCKCPRKNIFTYVSFFKTLGNILQRSRRELTQGTLRSAYGWAPGSRTEGFLLQFMRVSWLLLSCKTRRFDDGVPAVFALSCQASLCKSTPGRSHFGIYHIYHLLDAVSWDCLVFAIQITEYQKDASWCK